MVGSATTTAAPDAFPLARLKLPGLFEQAPGFMALLSGPEHRFELVNAGYQQLVGHRRVVGRTVAEALPEVAQQGYVDLLDGVFKSGEAYVGAGALYAMQATPGGPIEDRYVDFVFQPVRAEDGRVIGIFVQGADVTERVRVLQRRDALIELTDRFRAADGIGDLSFAAGEVLGRGLDASRVGFGTINADTDTLFVERDWTAEGVETLEGVTPLRDYGSFIDSLKAGKFIRIDDVRLDARTAPAAAALEGRSARSFVNFPVLEGGRLVAVLFVNSDRARHWTDEEIAFVKEVAERTRTAVERSRSEAALRESERHLKLMVLELNHRVKNNLATIQAIANQTFREARSATEIREAFLARISALAVAHDILTREQWEGLGIREVARGVLDALQGAGGRIALEGSQTLVTPKAGLALALAFHELGTNALKYGALSVPKGHVTLTWWGEEDGPDAPVSVRWIERDGPPVTPPSRRGFGSRLLERALAAELNGRVTLDYPSTGVVCTITGDIRA